MDTTKQMLQRNTKMKRNKDARTTEEGRNKASMKQDTKYQQ